jgi:hypothetical protein
MQYPTQGPAMEITYLPDDEPHYAEATPGCCGSSRLRMAVGRLVLDDAYPALRATRECDGGILICRDDDHLAACETEVADLGGKSARLGVMRLVRCHNGDMAVECDPT